MLVGASVKAQNLKELIALIKAQPGKFNYGSSGVGTPPHLSGELFKSMTGVKMEHIPYKGGGPAMIDLIAGQIPILFDVLSGAASHIRAGSVLALAVTTSERSASFPDVPTMAEAGLPVLRPIPGMLFLGQRVFRLRWSICSAGNCRPSWPSRRFRPN